MGSVRDGHTCTQMGIQSYRHASGMVHCTVKETHTIIHHTTYRTCGKHYTHIHTPCGVTLDQTTPHTGHELTEKMCSGLKKLGASAPLTLKLPTSYVSMYAVNVQYFR